MNISGDSLDTKRVLTPFYPSSNKQSLLIECGQHWEAASSELAIQTSLKLLLSQGVIDQSFMEKLKQDTPKPQKFIEVTEAITIQTDKFSFTETFEGGECIAKKGTVIGHDDETPIITPYDNCVLIMPTRRTYKGQTAVRLGKYIV